MAWHDKDGWLTAALSPTPTAILITLAIALLLPVLLHAGLYRKAAKAADKPTILLLGPTGAGKTALTTLVCAILPSPRSPLPPCLPALRLCSPHR
jgi:signal recognition particle receptor subunit beta